MLSLVVFLHVGVYSVAAQLEFDACCDDEMVDADVGTVGKMNHLMGGMDFPAVVQDDANDDQTNAIEEEEDRDDDDHDCYYSWSSCDCDHTVRKIQPRLVIRTQEELVCVTVVVQSDKDLWNKNDVHEEVVLADDDTDDYFHVMVVRDKDGEMKN